MHAQLVAQHVLATLLIGVWQEMPVEDSVVAKRVGPLHEPVSAQEKSSRLVQYLQVLAACTLCSASKEGNLGSVSRPREFDNKSGWDTHLVVHQMRHQLHQHRSGMQKDRVRQTRAVDAHQNAHRPDAFMHCLTHAHSLTTTKGAPQLAKLLKGGHALQRQQTRLDPHLLRGEYSQDHESAHSTHCCGLANELVFVQDKALVSSRNQTQDRSLRWWQRVQAQRAESNLPRAAACENAAKVQANKSINRVLQSFCVLTR